MGFNRSDVFSYFLFTLNDRGAAEHILDELASRCLRVRVY